MIDLRYLKKVLEMLDESTVDSLEITSDKGMKLRVSKSPTQRGGAVLGTHMVAAAPAAPAPAAVSGGAAATAVSPPATDTPKAASTLLEVKSPMVGTYYSVPEPGSKPYLAVGDRIGKGQILCIIEAMKIMNEIESEFDGVVKEILAQNAHPVEYGQVLLRIDPNG